MIDKLYSVAACLLILTSSCNDIQKIPDGSDFYEIIINQKAVNLLDFNKTIDDYSIIPLESSEQCLIGNVDKVIFLKDRIYILDKKITKKVFLFDKTGTFINSIGNTGRGRGEYIDPADFLINENLNEVWIYCKATKNILRYNYQGKYIKSLATELSFKSFEFLNTDTIVAFTHSVYNILPDIGEIPFDLIAFDVNGNLLHKQFFNNAQLNLGTTVLTLNDYFCKSDNGIYLNWILHDTIYKLDGFKAIPYLALDYKQKKFTPNIQEEYSNHRELLDEIRKGNKYSVLQQIQVADNKILIPISVGAGISGKYFDDDYLLIDQLTKEMLYFDDIKTEFSWLWDSPIAVYGDHFISLINSDVNIDDPHSSRINLKNPSLIMFKFKAIESITKQFL